MAKRHDKGEEATRAEIIAAAMGHFAARGVTRASLADIAHDAGLSKGTLNYYYASKEMLLLDAAHEHVSSLTRQILGILSSLTRDTTDEAAEALLYSAAFPAGGDGLFGARLHLALLHEAAMGNEAPREFFARSALRWRTALEVGVLRARADLNAFAGRSFTILAAAAAARVAGDWI